MLLIEKTEVYRTDTEEEVKRFIESLKEESFEQGYELKAWSSDKKEKKAKGEIIDEGYQVKVKKIFNSFWG